MDQVYIRQVASPGYISMNEAPQSIAAHIAISPEEAGEMVRLTAVSLNFRPTRFDVRSRTLIASRPTQLRLQVPDTTLLVRWEVVGFNPSIIGVEWGAVQTYKGRRIADPSVNQEFGQALRPHAEQLIRGKGPKSPGNPVVPPGGQVPERWQGQLLDYSYLLAPERAGLLRHGVLGLGQLAFGHGAGVTHHHAAFLPSVGSFPLEQLGIMICAPQGTGKTHLLLSWAAASAAAGQNVFVVDVKGNMSGPLKKSLAAAGSAARVVEFSTDPFAKSDRVNFLSGIHAGMPDCVEQISMLAEAILPGDSYHGRGEQESRWVFSLNLLRGIIQLLKLREWYDPASLKGGPGPAREVDLTDLYELANSEGLLMDWFIKLEDREGRTAPAKRANYTVADCLSNCAAALGTTLPPGYALQPDGEPWPFPGERSKGRTFQDYVWQIRQALEPFRANGPMGLRVRGFGPGQQFHFETFGLEEKPVVMVLVAREQDSRMATVVLNLAVRRLEQVVQRRRNNSEQPKPLLLLLDETSRIKVFDAPRFVAITRDARVGYAFVYQSLAQAGTSEQIAILMANIGTQIFLGGIRGDDYRLFASQFPKIKRVRWMPTASLQAEGISRGESMSTEEVPVLDELALHKLPAGKWPALVYPRGLRELRPFLVDLDDEPDGR